VKDGRVTFDELRHMKQKELVKLYPDAARTTLNQCREAALIKLIAAGYSNKGPT
jgi:ATP/maltotriose-dependent transcriptional regulator MalT